MKLRGTIALAIVALLSLASWGQGTTSRITGVVSDKTGAVISGATVTARNEGTNVSYTATSSASGTYVFDSVQIGNYSITVEAKGFKKFVATGNILEIGAPLSVNAALEIGATTETVEVKGGYDLVQTESSGNFGTVMDTRAITEMPIVGTRGRNVLSFVDYVPGVVGGDGLRCNTGGCSTVHGTRDRAWNYVLDGIDTNETSAGGSELTPTRVNPDAISEFKLITSQQTAEYGRSPGGQVVMVTKSGTNSFHGNGFWFYQTPAITANTYQNKAANPQLGRPQFVQNIYGGSVGGPIIKNKTFFFANVQLLHALNTSTVTRTVYTDSAKKGLFRYSTVGRNTPAGATGASVDAQGNPIVPIATYNIPANDPQKIGLDASVQKFLALAPSPNTFNVGDGLNTAGFIFNTPQLEKQVDLVVKVDHMFNARNAIFVRWAGGHQNTIADTANTGQAIFPGQPPRVNTNRSPRNLAINWRVNPTANTTNELVAGMNRFGFDFLAGIGFLTPADTPPFVFSNVQTPLNTANGNSRFLTTEQLVDNFTWIHQAHTFKFGTNLRYGRHIDHRGGVGSLNAIPQITFSTSANPVTAAFNVPSNVNSNDVGRLQQSINELLGRIGSIQEGYVAKDDNTWKPAGTFNIMDQRWPEYDFYGQDTWKLRSNLTLDLGITWDNRMAPDLHSFKNLVPDQPFNFGLTPTDTLKWVQGKYYNSDLNNFGPSIGFAWAPFRDGKTSVRGNYRVAFDRINTFSFSSTVFQGLPGLTYQLNDTTLGQGGLRAANYIVPPPPATPASLRQLPAYSTNSITVADPSMRTPKVYMWGLSIQREIMHNTVLSLTYNGNHGVGLYGAYDANQADITNNGFLDAFKTIQAGGTSALMDKLTAPDRRSGETTLAYINRMSSTALATNNVAGLAGILANRILANGQPLSVAAGLSPFFFKPYPQVLGGLTVLDTRDYSVYHGLETVLERRMSNGMMFMAAWTWSKVEDSRSFDPTFTTAATGTGQSAASTPFDIHNPHLNWAPSDLDRTHVIQGNWVYELPFGNGKRFGSSWNRALDEILGGWEIAGNATYQTGRPMTLYAGANTLSSVVGTPVSCTGKCDPYFGAVYRDATTHNPFFLPNSGFNSKTNCMTLRDASQLCIPAAGQFSNIGRNFFRQGIYANLNATVGKSFKVTEHQSLQMRMEMQNLTNSEMYDFLASFNIQSTVFGRMNQSTDGVAGNAARKIQLSLKYNF